jgi:hypothetical protein
MQDNLSDIYASEVDQWARDGKFQSGGGFTDQRKVPTGLPSRPRRLMQDFEALKDRIPIQDLKSIEYQVFPTREESLHPCARPSTRKDMELSESLSCAKWASQNGKASCQIWIEFGAAGWATWGSLQPVLQHCYQCHPARVRRSLGSDHSQCWHGLPLFEETGSP